MVCWTKLGTIALGTILKLSISDSSQTTVLDGTLKIFDLIGDHYFEKRKLQREQEAISDKIAESCNTILDYHSINEDRKQSIIEDITSIIADVEVTYSYLIEKRFDFEEFYRLFDNASKNVILHYDTKEAEIFERLLRHVSNIIFDAVLEGPQFTNHGIKEVFSCMDSLSMRIDEIIKKLHEIDKLVNTKSQEIQNFDRQYRNIIKERYGWVRLLGANTIDRIEKKYSLSIAYVRLEMAEYNETGNRLNPMQLLETSKTILIEGNAGSGKTTFLQWLALTSSANNIAEIPQLKNTIPIMIELRSCNCKELSLNNVINTVMRENGASIPENWLNSYLEAGNALILIDGVDEVKQDEREYVYDWIEEIHRKYKKVWIIITTRPNIEIDISLDHSYVNILPMSPHKIDIFLDYWHKAVLIEKRGLSEDKVNDIKHNLSLFINKSDSVRKLVSNPLLCSMICALNYKNGSISSTRRNDLYNDCCRLLLDSRDQARDIHTYDEIKMEYDEKRAILEYLAYWMMKNDYVSAEKEDVLKCIGRAKKHLRFECQQYPNQKILDYFLERSGILRSPAVDKIDFIHKSFQEYLTASEINREDDWGFIADRAFQIEWYETLILSIGFASTKQAQKVIQKILEEDSEEATVIAAACAENTPTLSLSIRKKINSELQKIMPPKNFEDCKQLASAGEHVIPMLAYNNEYTLDQVYYCLVTLSYIKSEKVLSVVGTYLQPFAEKRVVDCIEHIACSFYDLDDVGLSPGFVNSEIAIAMKNYVIEMSKSGSVVVPESFITSFCEIERDDEKRIIQDVTKLEIYNYHDACKDEYWKLFTGIQELTVSGEFDSFDILCDFSKSLRSVTVCDYSNGCDISLISRIALPKLEKLHIHTGREIYFDGEILSAFCNLQEFGLYVYNNRSQIYLDHFTKLKSLKKIEIYAEFYAEISYDEIVHKAALGELVIYIPYGYSLLERETFKSTILSLTGKDSQPNIQILDFNYPFGDELGSPTVYHY